MASKKNVSGFTVKRLQAMAKGTKKAADYWQGKLTAKLAKPSKKKK